MKVALYSRVSTTSQTTENQTIRLIEYVVKNGWSYDLYEEVESARKTRPVKQRLLEKVRNHEYDAVVIWRLDRWARSSTELLLEVKEMVDKKIGFISLSDNLDFHTAIGKLHLTILSAFAEFERNLISERTKEGLARAKSEGKSAGRPKGAKDSKKRKKSGYILRAAKAKQVIAEKKGIYKNIENYI
ncbi:MAG: recombinase family protein [Bacteroidota bacterium]|nr:recombinase family protein [Bacteroidota bacterium]